MTTASWNGHVIAQSDDIVEVEGNKYFPRSSVDPAVLVDSETTSYCGWKGKANYLSLSVGGETNPDAVWYYDAPFDAAKEIKDRVAFWKGVTIAD